jgi:hypothetical protein
MNIAFLSLRFRRFFNFLLQDLIIIFSLYAKFILVVMLHYNYNYSLEKLFM